MLLSRTERFPDKVDSAYKLVKELTPHSTIIAKAWSRITVAEILHPEHEHEFFSVGKYLVIGIFISSVFQTLGTGIFTTAQSGAGLAISMVIMMAMAFVLSLCSSSDAIVARSFANQFPMGGIMGFTRRRSERICLSLLNSSLDDLC